MNQTTAYADKCSTPSGRRTPVQCFAYQLTEAEAMLVAIGRHTPKALQRAAAKHGLRGCGFGYHLAGKVLDLLLRFADLDIQPTELAIRLALNHEGESWPITADCLAEAAIEMGVPVTLENMQGLQRAYGIKRFDNWGMGELWSLLGSAVSGAGVERYAKEVADRHAQIQEAAEHRAAYLKIVSSPDDPTRNWIERRARGIMAERAVRRGAKAVMNAT